ncbi:MAG: DEAD/DEAH box helicase [Sandaracinaceae bacterium]|nr:DEAD/DEAH box helicase [Sandaracinaceae bacterium]
MSSPTTPPSAPTPFHDFGLDPRLADALAPLGFEAPTPIQLEAIPALLVGRDVIGRARTGSGKTAAFGLPLLERVKAGGGPIRALVLTPTRELALQVTDALRSFAKNLPVRLVTVYGGAAYGPQLRALEAGVPVVVGTPGRVLDLVDRGKLDLSALEMLVLDEADEMLRMGFFEDVQRVLEASPPTRQIALFSASMPEPIARVAEAHLREPIEVQVEREALTVHHIEQRALLVPERHKGEALTRLLAAEPIGAALVFARTRAGCAAAADDLAARGVPVDALHGDLNQAARERVLSRFRSGRLRVVVATDVAARGIDVEHVTHVINYDLPTDAEGYVHRIGRTGRAGRAGVAISLVTPAEVRRVRALERTLDTVIAKVEVPTDAEIAAAKRARLLDEVRAAASEAPAPALEAMLDALAIDPRRAAAAALGLLARDRDVALDETPDTRPPSWARRAAPAHPSADEVELFLPIGRTRGVRPGDLVGALANELEVPGSSIGRVTIVAGASFVRVTPEVAERALGRVLEIRGHRVAITRSRRPEGADAPRGPGPGRRGPRPRPAAPARPKKRFDRNK